MKKLASVLLSMTMLLVFFSGCSVTVSKTEGKKPETVKEATKEENTNMEKGATYMWKAKNDKYENFTDLGNYIIDLDPHTNFNLKKAVEYTNNRYDTFGKLEKAFGCSAIATKAPNGDVLIGRNLDLTVSQCPCFITHTNFGKYKQINWTYDELNPEMSYERVLKDGKLDPDYYNALPLIAADSMNEEGLFIEYNMRGYEEYFACLGTNPGKLRICTLSLPCVVTANCKTVEEAIKYIKNELDLYTCADFSVAHGWNMCYVLGDATGEYGLLEIAHDEIKYMPYQQGQGNYYVWPTWNAITKKGVGYGRLQYGMDHLKDAVDEESMLDLMSHIMWKNEIYGVKNSYKDEKGHLHFIGKDGKETMDWRDDLLNVFLVDEKGKLVEKSGYEEDHAAYLAGDLSKEKGYLEHEKYRERCDIDWLCDDNNFEALKAAVDKRYIDNRTYEMLDKYYAGDEKELRDNSNIWTTALSFGVNCTKKSLTLRFWEEEETVMKYQW